MELGNKISIMDDAFSDYIMKKISAPELEKKLSSFLSAATKKKIEVGVASNNGKESFFGMRIFPMPDQMDDFLKGIENNDELNFKTVYDSWKSINSWYLEIDSQAFDRTMIGFIPQELSALCLHEFGHTIYSEGVIERYYHAYREYDIRLSSEDKASKKVLYFLNKIPLVLACGAHNWKMGKNGVGEEIFADTTVEKLGYGEYLLSAFEKIIKSFGNDAGYSNDSSIDGAIKESVIWCNSNARDLVKRKNNLKNDLYYQSVKTDSGFVKKMVYNIMQAIGAKPKEKYTGNEVATESYAVVLEQSDFLQKYDIIYDIKVSGFLERRCLEARRQASIANESASRSKLKVPNQEDIDAIYIENDRINNHMDRRYVLDLIYNQIEKIEDFKKLFDYNNDLKDKYEVRMDAMLAELESIRKSVLAKKSFDKSYKVFVKYPQGYEG